ncbi:MAG: TetR/AcrR family transcriptional regulator [Corynebacterium sp.]|uniref:TetR/AcrR family transcriptional regulator n=1 Tax=unclassified Corynebacterium TaxID=2624378 RepID=UPI0009699137|nr:TetR/AcrR family transcriptional regulator [Corynebacterium sp. CNJ-954]OLT54388.1 hypothetical protein BJF89_16825 [Corynebacterium sp. CNJ-954]
MGQHGDRARATLMDAAEELFARHGLDAVSNRAIAEHAGTANHSAVGYHFGGRDGLLSALLHRGRPAILHRRQQLLDGLSEPPALTDVVTAHVLPWIESFASLPVPSWRARFLRQLSATPALPATIGDEDDQSLRLDKLLTPDIPELTGVPRPVLYNRARMVDGMVLGTAAVYEGHCEQGKARGSWPAVGYFLIDAASGMLSASVTHPVDFLTPDGPDPSGITLS